MVLLVPALKPPASAQLVSQALTVVCAPYVLPTLSRLYPAVLPAVSAQSMRTVSKALSPVPTALAMLTLKARSILRLTRVLQ
jgi:hypothetical protein